VREKDFCPDFTFVLAVPVILSGDKILSLDSNWSDECLFFELNILSWTGTSWDLEKPSFLDADWLELFLYFCPLYLL
jgi:hypothetical protein